MAKTDLSNQRQVFVEVYVRSGDHLEAARRWHASIGFKNSKSTFLQYYTKIPSLKWHGTES